jgi:hypothetical protein
MGRRKSTSNFARKPGYFEKLKMGTAHETYDVEKEGFGSEAQWQSMFNVRMGFEEAQNFRRSSKSRYGKMNEYQLLAEFSGKTVNESSVWEEIRSAFRKASMNTHPDRINEHGKGNFVNSETGEACDKSDSKAITQAEFEFKHVSAAFAMLEDIYRSEGRLK